MKKRWYLSLAAACALLLQPITASAGLLEVDYANPGDKLLTWDSATELQWVDLTATSNMSVNDILGGAGGWIADGFRHATLAEVEDLFWHAGAAAVGNWFTDSNRPAVNKLANKFGLTSDNPGVHSFSHGFAGLNEIQPNLGSVPLFQRAPINGPPSRARIYVVNDLLGFDVRQPVFAHYLVRHVDIPEPTTLGLLAISSLALTRRRRSA